MEIRLEIDTGLIAHDKPGGPRARQRQRIERGRDAMLWLALPAHEQTDERVERIAGLCGPQGLTVVVSPRGGARRGAKTFGDASRGISGSGQRLAQPVDIGRIQEHLITVGCVIVYLVPLFTVAIIGLAWL